MGLTGRDDLLYRLRGLAKRAFYDVMDSQTEEALCKSRSTKKASQMNIVRALPGDVQFEAEAIDLSSWVIPLAHRAETGAEVKRRLNKLVNELMEERGTQRVVFCIDNSDYVPVCKQMESSRRARASREEPYTDGVSYVGVDAPVPIEAADFGDDLPMPDSAIRLKRTPVLMRRFQQYVGNLLITDLQVRYPVHVVVCGVLYEEEEETTDANGAAARKVVWRAQTRSRQYTGGESPVTLPSGITTHRAVRVGEGEGKCVYWMLRMFREIPDLGSVCVRCNDTDAITALLLNVHRVLSLPALKPRAAPAPQANGPHRRRTREIWLDYSSPQSHERYINITDLWRALQSWSAKELPQPFHQHSPEAAVLVATMMGGCDYVSPIKGVGAARYLAELFDKPKTLAANGERQDSVCMFSTTHPMAREMVVVEGKLADLTWRALQRVPAVRKIMIRTGFGMIRQSANGGRATDKRSYEAAEGYFRRLSFKQRFDELAYACVRYNSGVEAEHKRIDAENERLVAAGQKKKSKPMRAPEVPRWDALCAMIRRVMWTVHYFRNIGIEHKLPPFHTDPVLVAPGGASVYGYRLNSAGRCVEAESVGFHNGLSQPFLYPVRGEQESTRLRRREMLRLSSASAAAQPVSDPRSHSAPPNQPPPPGRLRRAPNSAPDPRHRMRKRSRDEVWDEIIADNKRTTPFSEITAHFLDQAVDDPHGTNFGTSFPGLDVRRSV